jgi:predicted nuclease of predicted toxin-antitoxin system
MAISFKVGENLPVEVARHLTDAGHFASTVMDQDLGGAEDQVIADRCASEGYVLATLDVGFADIMRYPPEEFEGIIVLRLQQQAKDHVLEVVRRLTDLLETEPLHNRLWIVDEGRLRIRE